MHAQGVCIIAAYPVLRLCDAGNIAALSAHAVSNTELPHEFTYPHRANSARTTLEGLLPANRQSSLYLQQLADKHFSVATFATFPCSLNTLTLTEYRT